MEQIGYTYEEDTMDFVNNTVIVYLFKKKPSEREELEYGKTKKVRVIVEDAE